MLAVVRLVSRKDSTRAGFSHDEDVVENLTVDAADDPFAMRDHPGSSRRSRNHTQLLCFKYGVKALLYLPSRSRSRKRQRLHARSEPSARFRACTVHSRVGCAMMR